MLIDCDRCKMRDLACSDCVVSVMLGGGAEIGGDEQHAIGVLAEAGLVPPLRLVVSDVGPETSDAPRSKKTGETPLGDLPGVRSAG